MAVRPPTASQVRASLTSQGSLTGRDVRLGTGRAGLLLATVCLLASSGTADARPSNSVRLTLIADGLRTTLVVPRRAYAMDSLVRVRLTVENIGHHPVRLVNDCPFGRAWVEVVGDDGSRVFPPALNDDPAVMPCTASSRLSGSVLARRAILRVREYVILRGSRIRGEVSLRSGRHSFSVIDGRPLRLRLHSALPPRIVVSSTPYLHADIYGSPQTRGRLLYRSWERCAESGGQTTLDSSSTWQAAVGTTLIPTSCKSPIEWHVVAGWVGSPVAYIDYQASPDAPYMLYTGSSRFSISPSIRASTLT